MSQQPHTRNNDRGNTSEIQYAIGELEDMVSQGKRFPMSRKVMVDEDIFRELLEDIRTSIPIEMRDAQKLLKERERVIGEAQEEALRIVNDAQRRANVLISEHTVLAEAKQLAEEELRLAEKQRQEAQGRMEVFFLQQLASIRNATLSTMGNMEATVERALSELERAEAAISGSPEP